MREVAEARVEDAGGARGARAAIAVGWSGGGGRCGEGQGEEEVALEVDDGGGCGISDGFRQVEEGRRGGQRGGRDVGVGHVN